VGRGPSDRKRLLPSKRTKGTRGHSQWAGGQVQRPFRDRCKEKDKDREGVIEEIVTGPLTLPSHHRLSPKEQLSHCDSVGLS
jgi:hypothetical protein